MGKLLYFVGSVADDLVIYKKKSVIYIGISLKNNDISIWFIFMLISFKFNIYDFNNSQYLTIKSFIFGV